MSSKKQTAAGFLQDMLYLNLRIESKKKRLLELKLLSESTGGLRYDKDRVVTSLPQEAGFENHVLEATMLQLELEKDISVLTVLYQQGRWILDKVHNPIDKTILDLMYFDGRSVKEIAVQMHYSESNIYYRRKRVMDSLQINLF